MLRSVLISWLILFGSLGSLAQDRFEHIRNKLEAAMVEHPGLDGVVELSVSGTTVPEFVRALGVSHKLNISVDPVVQGSVVNNFSDARVADILVYLCKNYDLDLEIIGSIISLKPYVPPPLVEAEPLPPTPPQVEYRSDERLLDLDLRNDTLSAVAREINLKSGTNVVLAPGIGDHTVSIFLRNAPVESALQKLAFANGLLMEATKDGTILLDRDIVQTVDKPGRQGKHMAGSNNAAQGDLEMELDQSTWLNVRARNVPMGQIIERAADLLEFHFYLYDPIENNATLFVEHASFQELLTHMLQGTEFTFKVQDGVVFIGKRDLEGLRRTELVRMQNRPIKSVLEVIPEGIRSTVTITEFPELNGLILSGDPLAMEEIKAFIRTVDQVVPVIMIEVMIVDVNRSRTMSTGISMGLGGGPEQSGGTVLPGVNYDMTSVTLNSLINSFNGFGIFNLGNVTQDFYLSIQALETDGVLRLRSTPQLSTLNGHEANLSIGQTEYYAEIQNNIIGTQNPTVATSQIYKPVTADLSLKIMPVVSSEDVVTLEIEVNQSNFTERIAETAPPGTVERTFSSTVRVRDRDMVVLGGLEEVNKSQNGSGLPFIARIPIIKWILGKRSMTRSKSKLTIFIKPTIIN